MADVRTDTFKVIVGAAHLFYANANIAVPATIDGPEPARESFLQTMIDTADAADSDWTYVGLTSDGIEVAYEPDYGEIMVDQMKSPARVFNQAISVSVNTNLAEATLRNLALAWGQPEDSVAGDVFTIGDIDDPVERKLVLIGPAPKATSANDPQRERIYTVSRCISVESSSHAFNRTSETLFPVSFRALQAGTTFGTVVDRTIETVV